MSTLPKRILKYLIRAVAIIVVLVLVLVAYIQLRWNAGDSRQAPVLKAPTDSVTVARGEYIFKFQTQCWGCHGDSSGGANAPPSGGMLFDLTNVGPGFGKWYARNITPDRETGIGSWTDGEIVQALREGVSKNRTTLFPIMPVDWYHGMADDDALALVAYLRSIPPVKNKVPGDEPSLVAKALLTFKIAKPKDVIATPVIAPPRGITPEYGRYLSSHLSDCADCHTPRNLQDGHFYLDSLFAGSSITFGGGDVDPIVVYARNITPDKETGIGSWTEEQFLTAVTAGMSPDGTVLSAQMPYAYYKSWELDDLRAVFAYLKTLPARRRTVPPIAYEMSLKTAQGPERGKLLFRSRCQVCHGKDGLGAPPTHVKLAAVVSSLDDKVLKEFISSGQMNLKMPAFGKTLKQDELNDLVSFMRTWQNK